MAMLPPFDPNQRPPGPDLDPTGRQAPEPDIKYVLPSEATNEDRMTVMDKAALVAGIGCAQFVRLLIIVAAIGLVFLIFFLVSHL